MIKLARLSVKEKRQLTPEEKLILFWRLHPVRAAMDILGVELIWLQRIILRWMWFLPFVSLFLGRGCGKTWLWSVFAILYAMLYPRISISYVNPTMGQSYQFWEYIQQFYEDSQFFRDSCYRQKKIEGHIKWGKDRLLVRFKNGSKIETIAVKSGDQAQRSRGKRYHVVILDEYKDYDPNIINTVIAPWLTVERKGMINKFLTSTTGCYTWNHAYLKRIQYQLMNELGYLQYRVAEFDYRDVNIVPKSDSPYRMSKTMINQIRNEPGMTEENFKMEMFCYSPEESATLFTDRLLNSAKVTPLDINKVDIEKVGTLGHKYVMGVDIANVPNGDNFAIQIIKLDDSISGGGLVYSFAANGWDTDRITLKLFECLRDFDVVRFFIDRSGSGHAVCTNLASGFERYKVPRILEIDDKNSRIIQNKHGGKIILRAADWSVRANTFRMDLLKSFFEHGRLRLPYRIKRHDIDAFVKISTEVQRTKYELTKLQPEKISGGYRYESSVHKDRAVALALANEAIHDYYYVQSIEKQKELPIGMSFSRG